MHRDLMPDLMIVGDSHTAALHQAALDRGMRPKLLYLSGNFWHEGRFRWHPGTGLNAAYRPRLQARIRAAAAETGGTVFPRDMPLIASFGYHLGRLAPLFARHGHTPDGADAGGREAALFVSDALLRAYLHHHRGALLKILRLASRSCDLVVVAPPVVQPDPVAMRMAAIITEALRATGVRVFDPREEPGWQGPLPAHLRSADGVHGNAAYGAEVLLRLFDRGLIRAAA